MFRLEKKIAVIAMCLVVGKVVASAPSSDQGANKGAGSKARGIDSYSFSHVSDLGSSSSIFEKFAATVFGVGPQIFQRQKSYTNGDLSVYIEPNSGRGYFKVEGYPGQLRCTTNPRDLTNDFSEGRSLEIGITDLNGQDGVLNGNSFDNKPDLTLTIPTKSDNYKNNGLKNKLSNKFSHDLKAANVKLILEITELLSKLGIDEHKNKNPVLPEFLNKVLNSVFVISNQLNPSLISAPYNPPFSSVGY